MVLLHAATVFIRICAVGVVTQDFACIMPVKHTFWTFLQEAATFPYKAHRLVIFAVSIAFGLLASLLSGIRCENELNRNGGKGIASSLGIAAIVAI
jgi:hypothetical protein